MWTKIKQINWAQRSTQADPFEGAKQFILAAYTEMEAREITAFVQARHAEFVERLKSFEAIKRRTYGKYIGVDQFNDMVYHVIGLGKLSFEYIMQNPHELDTLEYVESFAYCLPHDEDFELRTETDKCVLELNRIITDTTNSPTAANLLQRCKLIMAGNFKDASSDITQKIYDDMRFFSGNDCDAKFANLIRDCNKYHVSVDF